MFDFNKENNSLKFRITFEMTWLVGLCAVFITGYIQYSNNNALVPIHEPYVDGLLNIMFIAGLFGARWRFFQKKNIRMFCITLGATVFLVSLCLFDLELIGNEKLTLMTYLYPVFAIACLTKK